MSFALNVLDSAFRDDVRRFLDDHLTEDLRAAGRACTSIYCDRPIAQRWLAILNTHGWAVPSWPKAHGGVDWTPVQHHIFASECIANDAPRITPNATRMLGPVLIAFGTDAQKARYLPAIPTGEDWWAQGYSEPGAGSDLAALQCRAVRDGDDYVINGSKIWTSHAQWSNRIFCLVRTRSEGKAQAGISFLIFDMDSPGVNIRPILTLAGDHEVNEVFFDNVRVPATALVGQENDGWSVAKYLLQHERSGGWSPRLRQQVRRMKAMLVARRAEGADLSGLQREVSDAEIATDALEAVELAALARHNAGRPPGAQESSMLKIVGTELLQRLDEIALSIAGHHAAPIHPPNVQIGPLDVATVTSAYLNNRAASIYAGSNEIQRNIIAGLMMRSSAV